MLGESRVSDVSIQNMQRTKNINKKAESRETGFSLFVYICYNSADTTAFNNNVEDMTMKPVIGITCNFDEKDEIGIVSHMGCVGQKWHFLADNYIASIEKAGGIPVMIPICESIETAKEMVSRMDGILISGGHDVDPRRYGQRTKSYCGTIMPKRDGQDIELVKYLLNETEKPILGVCRGIQVLNVAAGGTLYQDLEREGKFEHHFMEIYPMNYISHEITIKEGSKVRDIFGKEELGVNSFHHQAVRNPGDGFTVTAVSGDGVTEAIEKDGSRFVVGVQWHPEMMYDSTEQQKIFQALVDACTF